MVPTAEVLAIIPARGGSKGIAKKSVANKTAAVAGHSIEQARECIRGSTESSYQPMTRRSPAVAAQFGAESLNRHQRLAGMAASSESALLHAARLT